MQNIIYGIIMSFLLFPGAVFAASGPVGEVETLSATSVSTDGATLYASVYTQGKGTRLFFDYGETQSLGERTSSKLTPINKAAVLSMRARNLSANTTYYYRAVIEGIGGTTYGEIHSFDSSAGKSAKGTVSNTNTSNQSSGTQNNSNSGTQNNQTASVGNALGGSNGSQANTNSAAANQNPGGFFQRLFDAFTRARPIQLSVAMNPEKPKARDIIEYVVTYTNTSNQSIGNGELSVVIPDSVVYLADNSGGKTTLSKVAGGQKVTMATEPLSGKEKRTITLMAVAGSGVGSAVPTAIASIGYVNAQGNSQYLSTSKSEKTTPLVAATAASKTTSAQASANVSSTASDGGILPNTFFEWLVFLAVITGAIVIIRKVMAVYQERKKRILEETREVVPHIA